MLVDSWRCMGQQRPELVFTASCCLFALLVTVSYFAILQSTQHSASVGGLSRASDLLLLLGVRSRSGDPSSNKLSIPAWWPAGGSEAPPPPLSPIAICLTGSARDFEATGPSILHFLLPPSAGYSPSDLFINAPLDAAAAKLWALKDAASVAVVRIAPNFPIDTSHFDFSNFSWAHDPHYEQALLQHFRLVEGCQAMLDLRQGKEASGKRYEWIARGRLDSLWRNHPPPLSSLDPDAYTVPYGTTWWGENDRFGVGGPKASAAALRRVSALNELLKTPQRAPTSESLFMLQLNLTHIPVSHHNFSFCVLSRRTWEDCHFRTFALTSTAPLNGAYCRPCAKKDICLKGEAAHLALSNLSSSSPMWPGPFTRGLDVCLGAHDWAPAKWWWQFDSAVGRSLADGRKQVERGTHNLSVCEERFMELQSKTWLWAAPPPRALCVRGTMGIAKWLGRVGSRFSVFVDVIKRSSILLALEDQEDGAFELQQFAREKGMAVEVLVVPHRDLTALLDVQPLHILPTLLVHLGLSDPLAQWQHYPPRVCQLLLVIPHTTSRIHALLPASHFSSLYVHAVPDVVLYPTLRPSTAAVVAQLQQFDMHLEMCDFGQAQDTCTFFSSRFCA